MKKLSLWYVCMFLLTIGLGFTACSEDGGDNEGGGEGAPVNLPTPAFVGVSALYEVQTENSGIQSVELTEGGQYIITKAHSAIEALEILKTEKFDCILSDHKMPLMDG
ncbi:MAG: hypothetical protein IKA86_04285, partial [Paraprevotella sp.]|nr:hypothetical protein [Paraprevotella sp.]